MKIAVLIQCHKNPEQINLFLKAMENDAFTFFIHVDRKSSISASILKRDDIFLLPDKERVSVEWGKISQIDATLNLLKYARQYRHYDYYWLCSGQDFPIKPVNEIIQWFEKYDGHDFVNLFESRNNGLNVDNHYDKRTSIYFPEWILGNQFWKRITKRLYVEVTGGYTKTYKWALRKSIGLNFYYGSQWVCLSGHTTEWILKYINDHPEYYNYMVNTNCPDETYFQTLLMSSPYAEQRMDYLHYVDWSEGNNNPKTLKAEDYEKLNSCDKLMARKFESSVDSEILRMISERILK